MKFNFSNLPIKFVGGYYCGNKAITQEIRISVLPRYGFLCCVEMW